MEPKYTAKQINEAISYWQEILDESKVTDLIEKNKWSKKDALKPDNFKQIKKAWKKGDDYMKKVLDRVYDDKGKFIGKENAEKAISKLNKEIKSGGGSAEPAKKPTEASDKKPTEASDKKGAEEVVKPDAADEKAAKEIVNTKETVEVPVGDFNINTRMHRLHNGAVTKVKQNLGQFLNKQKAGSPETVVVTNSCDKNGKFEMPDDGKMYITIAVKLDKTQITGFRKMVALMKENDMQLEEGFFGDLVAGFKKGAKALGNAAKETAAAMGKSASEKLKTAHEKLKKNIGVEAMRTYVTAFCGKALGDRVSLKNIAMNEDEDGTEGAEITFKCLINIT